jgi:hypothetical protein
MGSNRGYRWDPAVVSSRVSDLKPSTESGPYTAIIFRAIPYICNALLVR